MGNNIQDALGIYYLNQTDKDKLLVTYSQVQGTIAASALSMRLKNSQVEGDVVNGGTVRVRRMRTSVVQPYGTARTQGYGNKLQNNGVDVKIDTDREIVEEIERKDILKYGIPSIIQDRSSNHALSMSIDLDKQYFVELQNAASSLQKRGGASPTTGIVDVSGFLNVEDKLLALIRRLESLENENVQKVDRNLMVLTLAPKWYDQLKKYINTLPNPEGNTSEFFHGVEVYSAPRQGFDAIVQVRGSVAQPVTVDPYEPARIPFSSAVAVNMFYYFGTKAVMPDCVFACSLDADISA